jgi:tol-pal system protein YbgF
MLSEPLAPVAQPGPVAAADPGQDPKLAYESAYGHMLQQDYGAAQAGFGEFLKRFPTHTLVPNALYWLGETYYVQKRYADAAEAFDIVIAAHGASNKAPDSQLKKAMTLSALGKSADACSALRQLAVKYPNAPPHVKTKADSERRRAGCT